MREFTDSELAVQRGFMAATSPPFPASEEIGIRAGVPAPEYHRRELHVYSKSASDQLDRSPAHYEAWTRGIEKEPTAAKKFGSALHVMVLEPERFAQTYAVAPDFGDCRNAKNKANRDAWRAEHAGKLPLSAEDERTILDMHASVMSHPAASRLILDGIAEVTVRWIDEITGLRCKSRADYWVKSKRLAVDLKSTEDASEKAFARSVYNFGYDKQDALYRSGFAACGEPIDHFAILAVEKEPPYAVAVYTLDEDAVAHGFGRVRQSMERLRDCIRTNAWPSYSDGVSTLSLPRWALNQ